MTPGISCSRNHVFTSGGQLLFLLLSVLGERRFQFGGEDLQRTVGSR